MKKLIDYLIEKPLGELFQNLPHAVYGEDDVRKFLDSWFSNRNGNEGRVTFNEIEALFRAIFFLSQSAAYHLTQAKIPQNDTLAHQMKDRDNFTAIESSFRKISDYDMGIFEDILTWSWDYFCLYIDSNRIDIHHSDSVLKNIINEGLLIAYKSSVVSTCKRMS